MYSLQHAPPPWKNSNTLSLTASLEKGEVYRKNSDFDNFHFLSFCDCRKLFKLIKSSQKTILAHKNEDYENLRPNFEKLSFSGKLQLNTKRIPLESSELLHSCSRYLALKFGSPHRIVSFAWIHHRKTVQTTLKLNRNWIWRYSECNTVTKRSQSQEI